MYRMEITGTFGLRIERGEAEPVVFELMFDHMAVGVEGVEPAIVADALVVAFHRAMVPTEQHVIDSLERTFHVVNDADTVRNKAWMLALVEAEELLDADSRVPGNVSHTEQLGKVARVLSEAGLRPTLSYDEVRRAARLLHTNGTLPDSFLAGQVSK